MAWEDKRCYLNVVKFIWLKTKMERNFQRRIFQIDLLARPRSMV